MIKIKGSKCNCGNCGARFLIDWNLPFLDVVKCLDGQQLEYLNNGDWECPHCANIIYGTLYVCESPIGMLKYLEVKDVYDSKNTEKSSVEKPELVFQ